MMLLLAALILPPCAELEAEVVYVDPKNSFIVIGLGKNDGLGKDFEFEIVRKTADGTTTLGSATFEKFLGRDLMAKLIVDEKTVGKVKVGDRVLCRKV